MPPTGAPAAVLDVRGTGVDRDATWASASVPLDTWAGKAVRIRFSAADGAGDGLVEAAFDDVRVTRPN